MNSFLYYFHVLTGAGGGLRRRRYCYSVLCHNHISTETSSKCNTMKNTLHLRTHVLNQNILYMFSSSDPSFLSFCDFCDQHLCWEGNNSYNGNIKPSISGKINQPSLSSTAVLCVVWTPPTVSILPSIEPRPPSPKWPTTHTHSHLDFTGIWRVFNNMHSASFTMVKQTFSSATK